MEISLMALIQGIPSELNVTFCMAVSTKKIRISRCRWNVVFSEPFIPV